MIDPGRSRVLVADDNQSIRKILCLFLQNAGYETVEARNGREALDGVKNERADLVILDDMMPLVDGYTVCRSLKEDPATRDVPIIICTARNKKEDLIAAIRAGAEDFIIKPFLRETVLQKVEKALSHRKVTSAARQAVSERRGGRRRAAGWTVSWGLHGESSSQPVFKTRILDISPGGFSFEFSRCAVCTGYEIGTVHPLCLFAKNAKRFQESEPIDFVLSVRKDVIIEGSGRIAHVYQWADSPRTEKVGVMIVKMSESDRSILERFSTGEMEA
ncbi:MAG: response regulator [Planctomycetes bacterium]|nr:response regulator [Planctomycetota bacterium]